MNHLITVFLHRFFGLAMYLIGSFIMYHTVYDKRLLQHPRYLPNQIQQEIKQGLSAMPVMAILTAPLFLAEVRGWSKLYNFCREAPFPGYNWLQYPLFICFTDSGIYWIHRGLHLPLVYRWLHKPHHKWVVPTPFASYAFHPLDGWSQSLPYHIFPFLFPLQKVAYLGLFIFVTVWTVLIRESPSLLITLIPSNISKMTPSTFPHPRSSTVQHATQCTTSTSTIIMANISQSGIDLGVHTASLRKTHSCGIKIILKISLIRRIEDVTNMLSKICRDLYTCI